MSSDLRRDRDGRVEGVGGPVTIVAFLRSVLQSLKRKRNHPMSLRTPSQSVAVLNGLRHIAGIPDGDIQRCIRCCEPLPVRMDNFFQIGQPTVPLDMEAVDCTRRPRKNTRPSNASGESRNTSPEATRA